MIIKHALLYHAHMVNIVIIIINFDSKWCIHLSDVI